MYICLQARPLFKDRKRFCDMVDPLLEGQYPMRGLYQALAIAAMCVQEQPNMRPVIADVVTALNYLSSQKYDPQIHPVQSCKKVLGSPKERSNGHRRTGSNGSDPRVRSNGHRPTASNSSETEFDPQIRSKQSSPRKGKSSPRVRSNGNSRFASSGSETESSSKGPSSPTVRSDGHRHFVSNGSGTDSSGD